MAAIKNPHNNLPACGIRVCRTQNLLHFDDEPGARIFCVRCKKIFVKDERVGWRVQGARKGKRNA